MELLPFCMLVANHMKICISLRQSGHTIFEGVIFLFDLEYCTKKIVIAMPPTFKIGIP